MSAIGTNGVQAVLRGFVKSGIINELKMDHSKGTALVSAGDLETMLWDLDYDKQVEILLEVEDIL